MKHKSALKRIAYIFLLILPVMVLASTCHNCVNFSYQKDKTSKIGHISSSEDSCLACRVERQGTPNQPVVSVDLDTPILVSSIQLLPYAFIPLAFSPLQENRAPPSAA